MTKEQILLNCNLPYMLMDILKEHFEVIKIQENGDNIIENKTIRILVTNGETFVKKELIDKLPNLKLIANFGVGYDRINVEYALSKNILISNTPNVLTEDVADLAITLMLNIARQVPQAMNYIKNGSWERNGMGSYPFTTKISHKKIGIAGLGRIGMEIAKRALAFNMDISYFARSEKENAKKLNFTFFNTINDLASNVDFLVLALPGNPENHHIVNYETLQRLGPSGFLINIGRGSLVNEKDLIFALKNNLIKGAALDVFDNEPFINKDLTALDNVIYTPHIGSATLETRYDMSNLVFANIKAFIENKALITPIVECQK